MKHGNGSYLIENVLGDYAQAKKEILYYLTKKKYNRTITSYLWICLANSVSSLLYSFC